MDGGDCQVRSQAKDKKWVVYLQLSPTWTLKSQDGEVPNIAETPDK
jgi:hypothetical protein